MSLIDFSSIITRTTSAGALCLWILSIEEIIKSEASLSRYLNDKYPVKDARMKNIINAIIVDTLIFFIVFYSTLKQSKKTNLL